MSFACRFLVLVVALACLTTPTQATDYYIDYTDGDDNNSGLADTLAWKTLENVDAVLSAGNTIMFQRGETWRLKDLDGTDPAHFWKIASKSGTSVNPITITNYGDSGDPLPILTTLELWDGNWLGLVRPANVWKMSGVSTEPCRCFFDGVGQGRADSINDLDSTDSWYINNATNELYIYSTTNPANLIIETLPGDGSTSPSAVLLVHADYVTLDEIGIHGGQCEALGLTGNCEGVEITNCEIKYTKNKGINSRSSYAGLREDILIEGNTVDYVLASAEVDTSGSVFPSGSDADGIAFWSDADDVTIRDNYVSNFSHSGIKLSCFDESADGITNCTVESNEITAPNVAHGRGWDMTGVEDGATGNVVRWNYVHDTRCGNHCDGNSNDYYANVVADVSDDWLFTNAETGLNMNAWVHGSGGSAVATVCHDNRVFNNTVVQAEYVGIRVAHSCGWDTSGTCDSTNYVYNNTIANNIFVDCGTYSDRDYQIEVYDLDGISDNSFDNNCLYVSGVDTLILYKETEYTVAAANSANLDDDFDDNIDDDPDFDDYGNYDLHVPNTSPCYKEGSYIGSFLDYDGEAYHNPPTMGAFEWYKYGQGRGSGESLVDPRLHCFPNPSGNGTTLRFMLPQAATVRLTVHDVAGRLVATIAETEYNAGEFELTWDARSSSGHGLPSGVYFARLKTSDRPATMTKVILLR